jgi:hypothetical protein
MPVQNLRRCVFVTCLMIALLFGATIVNAQTGNAAISGIVSDSAGAVVQGAKVVLANRDSGAQLSDTTGTDGRYTFPTVPPGKYSITVTATTFAPKVETGIEVVLDQHLALDVILRPGSETTTVSVTGEVAAVDTTAYDVGGVVAQSQIETLPIQNRQYLNMGILVPGTTQAANRTFYNSLQAGSGLYFYASGFYLDGVQNQNTEEGDPRQNIPMGSVAEFKTYTSSQPIELGWAMGGFTTVATKSGTNAIHGEAFEYYRDTAMTGLNQFQEASDAAEHTGNPPYNRNQWGGDMGGPIVKDRMHYYGAYDDTEQTSSYTIFAPANAADFSATGLLGTFSAPYYDRLVLARWDYDLSPHQQLFVRYAQEWNYETRNGCGGSTTAGCYDGQIPRYAYVGGHTWEPNSHMVNEAHFQYAYISYELGPWGTPVPTKPTDLTSPSYTTNISQAFSFPDLVWGHNYAAVGVETRYELNDTLTWIHGAHQIKIGGDAHYIPYVDASASNLNGEWFFHADEPFTPPTCAGYTTTCDPSFPAGGGPYEFTQAATPLLYYLPSALQAYFVGDTWKIKPTLTFSYGLRWERQTGAAFLDHYTPNTTTYEAIPGEGNPHTRGDKRNFGPRLGISWDPFGKGKDVIRAGAGIYYNFIETELSEAEKLNFVACSITLTSNVTYPNPYGGKSTSAFCSSNAPSVTIMSPNLRNAYQQQFTLGYSRQLAENLSISADGVYARGLRDYKTYDLNYPLVNGAYAPLGTGTRPYASCSNGFGAGAGPCFTQITQHASTGSSEYRALYVKLERRLANRYMYTISYAWSAGYDNNPHSSPVNYLTPQNDWGPAGIDQPQSIVGSASWLGPWKILVGGVLTYRSAEPFSTTTSVATCANPTGTQTLPSACNGVVGGGVLPIATNANGTSQYVPGTKRDQGQHGINYAAINLYRSQLTGLNLAPVSASSVSSTNYLDFDLRVSKSLYHHEALDVQVFGQAFNLFGRENFTSITTNPTSTAFGAATNANTVQPVSNVQIGELGAKFTF